MGAQWPLRPPPMCNQTTQPSATAASSDNLNGKNPARGTRLNHPALILKLYKASIDVLLLYLGGLCKAPVTVWSDTVLTFPLGGAVVQQHNL